MRRVMVLPGEDDRMKEFGRRLSALVRNKGWTGSDLAREASKHLPAGPKGKKREMGRHLPSAYMRGLNYPNSPNLEAIAKALGVAPTDLVPDYGAAVEGPRSFINVAASGGGRARLTIDAEVDEDTALKVMKLVREGQSKGKKAA